MCRKMKDCCCSAKTRTLTGTITHYQPSGRNDFSALVTLYVYFIYKYIYLYIKGMGDKLKSEKFLSSYVTPACWVGEGCLLCCWAFSCPFVSRCRCWEPVHTDGCPGCPEHGALEQSSRPGKQPLAEKKAKEGLPRGATAV